MQENNNENKKNSKTKNDANDVMQKFRKYRKQMIQKKQMLLLSVKKMFPKANWRKITSLMFPIQSVKKKQPIITVLTMRKTILQFLPKKMTKQLRLSKRQCKRRYRNRYWKRTEKSWTYKKNQSRIKKSGCSRFNRSYRTDLYFHCIFHIFPFYYRRR